MYADPITVTVDAVPVTLPRVFNSVPGGPSVFESPDEGFRVEISHQTIKGRRERHLLKITQKVLTADPFVSANNIEVVASAYVVVDNPKVGLDDDTLLKLLDGLTLFLSTSTNGSKLIGGEA